MRAVVVIASAPHGQFRFACGDLSGRERQSNEEHSCLSRPMRAQRRTGAQPQSRSPGRGFIRAVFGGVAFARRQAIGGHVGTNRTPIAVEFLGAVLRLPRRLIHLAPSVLQDAREYSPNRFRSFLSAVAHGSNHGSTEDEACSKNQAMRFTA